MVSFAPPKAHALAWIDIETPGLPTDEKPNDYSGCQPLEVCMIVTDFELDPYAGYEALIFPMAEAVAALKSPANESAKEMHTQSGLLRALKAAKDAGETQTIQEVEAALINVLKTQTTFDKGEFMIAGSGVAAFDYPLLKHWMPKLASWFAYYPFDIGITRRTTTILAGGRSLVNPSAASYGDAKLHRARADVEAHLAEARLYQEVFNEKA